MNLDDLKNIKPKDVAQQGLEYYLKYNVTVLFIIALGLISFSVLRVQSLSEFAASGEIVEAEVLVNPIEAEPVLGPDGLPLPVDPTTAVAAPAPVVLQKIAVDETTVERLRQLADDEDVTIDSQLPTDRTNPF